MGTSIPLSISTVDFSLAENFIFQSTRSPEAETPLGRKLERIWAEALPVLVEVGAAGVPVAVVGAVAAVEEVSLVEVEVLVAGAVAEAGEQSIRI